MKTHRTALLAALTVAVLASTAFLAQAHSADGKGRGAEGKLHRLGRLAEYLELTDEQQASARQLFESFADKVRPLREDRREVREQLRTALEAPNPDPAQVGRLMIQIHDSGEQARAARAEMDKSFAALLTPEQRAKYDSLKETRDAFGPRRFGRRGHRGHGDHGDPGAPGGDGGTAGG